MRKTMNPGNYYIGDPCYALKNQYIDDFIDSMTYGTTSLIKEVDGKTIFFAKTLFGDGLFYANIYKKNNEYLEHGFGVDSGTLGAVPVELSKNYEDMHEYAKENLVNFEWEKSFPCKRKNDGIITIGTKSKGQIEIDTGDGMVAVWLLNCITTKKEEKRSGKVYNTSTSFLPGDIYEKI